MKNIFAIVISTLALTAFAADAPGPKKPCKEGQRQMVATLLRRRRRSQ